MGYDFKDVKRKKITGVSKVASKKSIINTPDQSIINTPDQSIINTPNQSIINTPDDDIKLEIEKWVLLSEENKELKSDLQNSYDDIVRINNNLVNAKIEINDLKLNIKQHDKGYTEISNYRDNTIKTLNKSMEENNKLVNKVNRLRDEIDKLNNGINLNTSQIEIDTKKFFDLVKTKSDIELSMLNDFFFHQNSRNPKHKKANENRYLRIALFTINTINRHSEEMKKS